MSLNDFIKVKKKLLGHVIHKNQIQKIDNKVFPLYLPVVVLRLAKFPA